MAAIWGVGAPCDESNTLRGKTTRCEKKAVRPVEVKRKGTGTRFTMYLCEQHAEEKECEDPTKAFIADLLRAQSTG
jgi:hypothetical protein